MIIRKVVSKMYLSFNTDTINDCLNDLGQSLDNKKVFMSNLIQERLIRINKSDLEHFDKNLKMLERRVQEKDCSIYEITRMLNKLSITSKSICKAELTLWKKLEKL